MVVTQWGLFVTEKSPNVYFECVCVILKCFSDISNTGKLYNVFLHNVSFFSVQWIPIWLKSNDVSVSTLFVFKYMFLLYDFINHVWAIMLSSLQEEECKLWMKSSKCLLDFIICEIWQ